MPTGVSSQLLSGCDATQVLQSTDQSHGAMAAHAKVSDVVEVDHSSAGLRILRLQEQCADHGVRATWLAGDGLATVVMGVAAHVAPFCQCASAEIGEAGEYHASGFAAGMRVDKVEGMHGLMLAAMSRNRLEYLGGIACGIRHSSYSHRVFIVVSTST
jgi:hypothetical protein